MSSKFRPCVAALLQNSAGQILVAERLDHVDSWQFPQGGVDRGESDEVALVREMGEELSLKSSHFKVLQKKEGYRYEFPRQNRRWGKYLGQEQTYFLCSFVGPDSVININTPKPEFRSWKWIQPTEFQLAWLPEFKRGVYRAVMKDFFDVTI